MSLMGLSGKMAMRTSVTASSNCLWCNDPIQPDTLLSKVDVVLCSLVVLKNMDLEDD